MPLDAGDGGRGGSARNVLGGRLEICSLQPRTGFYRTGGCHTGPDDLGCHTVCVEVTEAFLAYSKARGNDLSTPRPEFGFAGLRPGDRWCLCAARWAEALEADRAPGVVLRATEISALGYCALEDLRAHGIDGG